MSLPLIGNFGAGVSLKNSPGQGEAGAVGACRRLGLRQQEGVGGAAAAERKQEAPQQVLGRRGGDAVEPGERRRGAEQTLALGVR